MSLTFRSDPERPAPDYDFTSTIGIGANWSCVRCPNTAITYQVAHVATVHGIDGLITKLDPPQHWTVFDNATYCPVHSIRGGK